jgi:hypothetical protein
MKPSVVNEDGHSESLDRDWFRQQTNASFENAAMDAGIARMTPEVNGTRRPLTAGLLGEHPSTVGARWAGRAEGRRSRRVEFR